MAEDKKHMDVAKPGTALPQTGAKPMVIGHKPISNDPTIKNPTDAGIKKAKQTSSAQPAKSDTDAPSKRKLEIKPLSEEEVPAEKPADTEKAAPGAESVDAKDTKPLTSVKPAAKEEERPIEHEQESDVTRSGPTDDGVPADSKAESSEDSPSAHEQRLKEMTASKEYFVPIKERHRGGGRTFVVAFALTILIAGAVLLGLIDAEIIDLGITAPTDFL